MSKSLAKTLEAEIVRLVPLVEKSLDELREHTRNTVVTGAQLGSMVKEGERAHEGELWTWLRSLPVEIREDTIAFALKAYRTRERHPDLDDVSQLQFALLEPSATAGTVTVERAAPKARDADAGFLGLLQLVQRAAATLGKLKLTQPVDRWSKVNSITMKVSLEPLAALHRELSRATAR